MKSHQTAAISGLGLCCLAAVLLSILVLPENEPSVTPQAVIPTVSEVTFAPQDSTSADSFSPELPPLILDSTVVPIGGAAKSATPEAIQNQQPAQFELLPEPLSSQPASTTRTAPTTSFFRPQFSPRDRTGGSGFESSNSGSRSEIPPVGINPPRSDGSRFEGSRTEGSRFDSGQDNSGFNSDRNRNDGPSNAGTESAGDYYDRDRANSFAPPADSGDNRNGDSNGSQPDDIYSDLTPDQLRSESAYGGSTNSRSGVSSIGMGNTGGQRINSNLQTNQSGFQMGGGSSVRSTVLPGTAVTGSSLFPSLPGTAIGISGHHGGNCNCDRCAIGSKQTCRTCCQPLCATQTILVPQLYTIYRTVHETHYRPEVREVPYFREETVTHRVPVIEKFPVIVKEPRIRNFKTYRREEYQVPREVSYTVMVPKPKTRQVTSERVESYEVPEEEQYTVMVPKEKEVRKTKYRIVKDKEPIFKEYVVMVPQQRKRVMIDYETKKKQFVRKVPYTVMEERELERKIIRYRDEIREVKIEEEYFEYVTKRGTWKSPRVNVKKDFIDGKEEFLDYSEIKKQIEESIIVQKRERDTVEQTYTVTVPYKEEVEEVYWENETYEEMVSRPSITKALQSRDVVKPYQVKIPYIEHVPQMYAINIPFETKAKKYRVVPQQTPVTKQQTVKRDMGRWVTETVNLETYEIGNDRCGCSTCCPQTRTVRKTRWVPNIVSQNLPYTTFKTAAKKVPYEVPVIKYRREPRQRMIPITKYRTEVRERVEKEYFYETSTKPASFPVTKFRMVRRVRPKTVTVYREETRSKEIPVNRYVDIEEKRLIPFSVKRVEPRVRDIKLPTLIDQRFEVDEDFTYTDAVPQKRVIVKNVTVRLPFEDVEKFTVKVPQIKYRDVAEVEEFEVEVPREVTYTVEVPEVRVKKEFIEIERKVPYVETTMVTEMVPEVKTRRVYKTRERTVSDIREESFMTAEEEVVTKTVYDTKYRDVPVFQSELYWEDVTKVLKKTVFKNVTRTVKRPALKKYKVNVPYQVKVRVPKQLTRMVPRQITVPIEACCTECCTEFSDLSSVYQSYMEYGVGRFNSWINTWP